ncbi:hypothetical protein BDR03DRAFT_954283 [Suillus americanus]|nr:hypothetical protein BDR03DRAFT_954283 [Suillus americanus]
MISLTALSFHSGVLPASFQYQGTPPTIKLHPTALSQLSGSLLAPVHFCHPTTPNHAIWTTPTPTAPSLIRVILSPNRFLPVLPSSYYLSHGGRPPLERSYLIPAPPSDLRTSQRHLHLSSAG